MDKVIRDGKVAVLISNDFGAGWYTWNNGYQELLFHPKLVEMVESGRREELTEEWVKEHLGIDIYDGGKSSLGIEWVKEGTQFKVMEYDGSESLKTINDLHLITA